MSWAGSNLLLDNDFNVLGVSVHSTAAEINGAAEDPQLEAPRERIERARRNLTHPRNRLSAEVGWLPGVAPDRARRCVATLKHMATLGELPSLARANLALALSKNAPDGSPEGVANLLSTAAYLVNVDAMAALEEINADRKVAGFPFVRQASDVEEALRARHQRYVDLIRVALESQQTLVLVDGLASAAGEATNDGRDPPNDLLLSVLELYENEARQFLEPEAETIRTLASEIHQHAAKGEVHLRSAVQRLIGLVEKWTRVAKPIQLVDRAQGKTHQLSWDLGRAVRGKCVGLVNDYNLDTPAVAITTALHKAFAEVPEMTTSLEEDLRVLRNRMK